MVGLIKYRVSITKPIHPVNKLDYSCSPLHAEYKHSHNTKVKSIHPEPPKCNLKCLQETFDYEDLYEIETDSCVRYYYL